MNLIVENGSCGLAWDPGSFQRMTPTSTLSCDNPLDAVEPRNKIKLTTLTATEISCISAVHGLPGVSVVYVQGLRGSRVTTH
jgi:hypothetical protein